MDEILAKGLPLAVFSMRVDVVISDIHQPVFLASTGEVRSWLDGCERRVLCAKNDFVDFTLARRELAIGRNRTRDVRGVPGVLRADVENHNVAVLDLPRKLVVMQCR